MNRNVIGSFDNVAVDSCLTVETNINVITVRIVNLNGYILLTGDNINIVVNTNQLGIECFSGSACKI